MDTVIPAEWRELSYIQRDILVVLAVNGPATGAAIHQGCGAPATTESVTHRNLSTLRERGLVERDRHPEDNRRYRNRLTADGSALVREAVVEKAESVQVLRA